MTTLTNDLDAPVRELLERIAPHTDLASPGLTELGMALAAAAADHDYLAPRISAWEPGRPIVPLHVPERGPRINLVHRETGQMGAVHDHAVWVVLAPISGIESHRQWQPRDPEEPARLELLSDGGIAAPGYVAMQPPHDIHDHGHRLGVGDAAYLLIMTGDDQFAYRRNEWDPDTGRHRVLEPGDRGRWLSTEPWPG